MALGQTLSILGASFLVVSYFYYGIVHVPEDLDGRDDVMWFWAVRKLTRAVSITGEYLGVGNRVVLSRTVSALLTIAPPVNTSRVEISMEEFGGVGVRVYRPDNMVNNGPALLWIHGGGWVTRTVESDDKLACELARRLEILIVSIDYRLAPEHPFPAGFDDCVAATRHLLQHASTYHINPKRVAIAGASAGGNLAAAVVLKLRDTRFEYTLEHQVLVVPCLQALDFHTPSYYLQGGNAMLPKDWMIHYWLLYGYGYQGNAKMVGYALTNDHTSAEVKRSKYAQYVSHDLLQQRYIPQSYLPETADHGDDSVWAKIKDIVLNPYFAPLMADDVTNLSDAYIITADYDVLRDDGLMYGRRLADAGNKVVIKNYNRAFHATIDFFNTIEVSKLMLDELVTYLGQQL